MPGKNIRTRLYRPDYSNDIVFLKDLKLKVQKKLFNQINQVGALLSKSSFSFNSFQNSVGISVRDQLRIC